MDGPFDIVIVGGGHNGLVAATMLGRAGRSVLMLERRDRVGGAAVSETPFAGIDVRLSRYAYLVSLFGTRLLQTLDIGLELRPRRVPFCVPGLPPDPDPHWLQLRETLERAAQRIFPTLTEPLVRRSELRKLLDDDRTWEALFERPVSDLLERSLQSDALRGVALTDATIGTFAPADDPSLRQNRCFLYHVIGNGTGRWEVPVGGMGALTEALLAAALAAGVEVRTGIAVSSLAADGHEAEVGCTDGTVIATRDVLANVAPAVLSRLLGQPPQPDPPEGSQLKLNMVVKRLPRLRDTTVSSADAFTGTLHINEGYAQLQRAYEQAAAGTVPSLPPCELYCHSLTDPSILSPELRAAGTQTLTLFGLHMPARLFADGNDQAKRQAVSATLRSVDSVLAEPIEDCLLPAADGRPCLEALTPSDLEAELGMPGGHIFHRDLAWPFAESEEEVGSWGVETDHPNVWLCGAGARRGGCISGIPGHNAARAVLARRG